MGTINVGKHDTDYVAIVVNVANVTGRGPYGATRTRFRVNIRNTVYFYAPILFDITDTFRRRRWGKHRVILCGRDFSHYDVGRADSAENCITFDLRNELWTRSFYVTFHQRTERFTHVFQFLTSASSPPYIVVRLFHRANEYDLAGTS